MTLVQNRGLCHMTVRTDIVSWRSMRAGAVHAARHLMTCCEVHWDCVTASMSRALKQSRINSEVWSKEQNGGIEFMSVSREHVCDVCCGSFKRSEYHNARCYLKMTLHRFLILGVEKTREVCCCCCCGGGGGGADVEHCVCVRSYMQAHALNQMGQCQCTNPVGWTDQQEKPYACSLRKQVPGVPKANLTQPQVEEKDCEARPPSLPPLLRRKGSAIFSISWALDALVPE